MHLKIPMYFLPEYRGKPLSRQPSYDVIHVFTQCFSGYQLWILTKGLTNGLQAFLHARRRMFDVIYSIVIAAMGWDCLCGTVATNRPVVHAPHDTWVNMELWRNDIDRWKPKDLENLSQCHVVHHKSHTDWNEHKHKRQRWASGD
jgi:hypothetical protein